MSYSIIIDMTELEDYTDKFIKGMGVIDNQAHLLFHEAGYNAESLAKEFVPVNSGNLRDSIFVLQTGVESWALSAATPYAVFVEKGYTHTSGKVVEGRPFIAPAVYMAMEQFKEQLVNVIVDNLTPD